MSDDDELPLWDPATNSFVTPAKPVAYVDIDALISEAKRLAAQRDWPAAATAWGAVIDAAPSDAPAYANAGEAWRNAGNLPESRAIIAQGLDHFPTHAELLTQAGHTAHRQRDWDSALSHWERLLTVATDRPHAYYLLGNTLLAANRLDHAETRLLECTELFPTYREARILLAWQANRARNWPTALERWAALHTALPANDQICTGYAEALLASNQLDLARAMIEAARALRPKDPANQLLEAKIAQAQGRHAEALLLLEAASAAFPQDGALKAALKAV
jgi:tetratricopeptide (TPR) repeat protein